MSICAIIVTYQPSLELIQNIELIREMTDYVIVYDNTPYMTDIISSVQDISNVKVIHTGRNVGLGVALNFGLQYAVQNHFEWLATFDQDSQPSKNMFKMMLKSLTEYSESARVRILAPSHRDPTQNPKITPPFEGLAPIQRKTVITSGNLINLKEWNEDLRFDESLFIDSVDHDFCLNILKHREIILECQSALLIHSIGQINHHKKFGIWLHATNHAPFRHYYMMRNRLYIWRRYLLYFPGWVAKDLYGHLKMMTRILMVEDEKLLKMRYMVKGFFDFLLGRKGQLNE